MARRGSLTSLSCKVLGVLLISLPLLTSSFSATISTALSAGKRTALSAANDLPVRMQGLDYLDETSGLWQLPRALVPLPHERLRLAQGIEAVKFRRTVGEGIGSEALSAHEAHSTFLPIRQALGEMHAKASKEERRCLVGISGTPGAGAADFARLLAAVLSHAEDAGHEYAWARQVECAVVGTAGYLKDTGSACEPTASPDEYECTRMVADLEKLRMHPHTSVDIAGGEPVQAGQGLVLVHGPYALRREGAWAQLDGLFDLTVNLQTRDEDTTGSTEYKDSLGRPYVPDEVASRILSARMEVSRWQDRSPADIDVRFQQQQDGSILYIPEALTLAPPLRRKASMLAVGLNPSYQKSLEMAELQVGDVNRAARLTISPGGKGQHFAIAGNRLAKSSVTVAHFLGRKGEEGSKLLQALEDMGVQQEVQWHTGVTRTCTTILEDSGRMTEIIEPSDSIPKTEVDELLSRLKKVVVAPEMVGVALCGTFPPGVQEEVYAGLAQSVSPRALLLLDGWKGVDKTLSTKRVNVLKINADELRWLTGEKELDVAAVSAINKYMAPGALLAVTRGANSARLYSNSEASGEKAQVCVSEFEITAVKAKNPIGAGDTCSAVLLYGLCAGNSPEDAFAFALAAASASCLNIAGAHFKAADAVNLYNSIKRIPPRPL